MRKLRVFLMFGLFVFAATSIFADQDFLAYNAYSDFSSVQGYRGWWYLDSEGNQLVWDGTRQWWFSVSETYRLLWSWGGHPGERADAVRRWVAPVAGSIRIVGDVLDADVGGGDGVVVFIKKGGCVLWQQTIQNGDMVGSHFDLLVSVRSGDAIDFVVNKRGNNWWDSTYFNPTIFLTPGVVFDTNEAICFSSDQKYLVMNIEEDDWFWGLYSDPADANWSDKPLRILQEMIDRIGSKGNQNIRLAFSTTQLRIMDISIDQINLAIDRMFYLARTLDLPVMIRIADVTWWSHREDLWNWFDPSRPGFNPDNINNVDWSCFDPACASRDSWRNWGQGFWVGAPAPNYESNVVRADVEARLNRIVPVLKKNILDLQKDGKDYLFAGVVLGWEQSIDQNASCGQWNLSTQTVCYGYRGYMSFQCPPGNPVCISGNAKPADFNAVLARIVGRYLEFLAKTVVSGGIPKERVYVHAAGLWDHGRLNFIPTAFNDYARPLWSMYPWVERPQEAVSQVRQDLQDRSFPAWGSGEANLPTTNYVLWDEFLNSVLNNPSMPNGKIFSLFNWEFPNVKDAPETWAALREVLNNSAP